MTLDAYEEFIHEISIERIIWMGLLFITAIRRPNKNIVNLKTSNKPSDNFKIIWVGKK